MKVVGLLSWWDEDPEWLAGSVRSALRVCDDVIALDGAYEGFPGGGAISHSDQYNAIYAVGGRPVTPLGLWATQMEKRTKLFEFGRDAGADWFLVFDADDLVVHAPGDFRARLERTREPVGVFTYGGERYHRGLFRSITNLRVEDTHHHYLGEINGRTVHLRGDDRTYDLSGFANFTDVRVAHRKLDRPRSRLEANAEYRRLVVERGIEALV